MSVTESLIAAFMLASVVKALLDYVAKPIRMRWPTVDLWYFDFVALALGGVLAWFAGIDLFSKYLPTAPAWETRLLTALVIGGGAAMLNQLFHSEVTAAGATAAEVETARLSHSHPYGW